MAMLAEPRRKKRYHLTPKGKPLFEDNDRFGTKMLEKMGWSKGKGLGKTEEGNQDFVRMKFKADDRGLGFEERDDQWTEHEKNFNGLLENLNNDSQSCPEDYDMVKPAVGLGFAVKKKKNLKDKISGQSLEEKSKNSKARVHYKKFTKGKDMSQYSEKDLANIFGKKANPEEANIYDQFQAFTQNDENGEDEKEFVPSGNPIIHTGVSVTDYFKSKMAALKEKQGSKSSNPFDSNIRIINNVEVFVPSAKRKSSSDDEEVPEVEEVPRKKKKTKSLEVEESETVEPAAEYEENQEAQVRRKKKKSKKQSIEEEELNTPKEAPEAGEIVSNGINNEEAPKKKKKDKKKKKQELEADVDDDQNHFASNLEESNSSKKKKSKNLPSEEIQILVNGDTAMEDEIPKKKKKKNKQQTTDESLIDQPKQTVMDTTEEIPQEEEVEEENNKSIKSKTKKNKTKTPPTTTTAAEVSSHPYDLTSLKNTNNFLLDIYTISQFCAEKFRHLEVQLFQGSNLTNLTGYGLSENLELNIKNIASDPHRLMSLWSGKSDKYADSTATQQLYSTYMKNVKQAKKNKSKVPSLKLASLKRKKVFQFL